MRFLSVSMLLSLCLTDLDQGLAVHVLCHRAAQQPQHGKCNVQQRRLVRMLILVDVRAGDPHHAMLWVPGASLLDSECFWVIIKKKPILTLCAGRTTLSNSLILGRFVL